ncbi:MAG: aspartate/glutamate racemase family protein [Clostridia bacterium]|nr:aspartate/glutamate racemase family protein [Clostridia bacterium]
MSSTKKSLGIIHAAIFTANAIQPFADKYLPGVEIMHCGDDTIQRDNFNAPIGQIPKRNFLKFANLADGMQRAGCDAILLGCSTFNQAAELAQPMIDIPIFQIDRPMMDIAVANGRKIGLLGTVPTTMPSSERLLRKAAADAGKEIEVVTKLNKDAFAILRSGDPKTHNDMLVQDILDMEKQGIDCVVLAQVSMAIMEERAGDIHVPMLTSGETCFKFLAEYFKTL